MMAAIARTVFTIWTPRLQNNPDPVELNRMFEPDCVRRNRGAETARLQVGCHGGLPGSVHAMHSALWIRGGKWESTRKMATICL